MEWKVSPLLAVYTFFFRGSTAPSWSGSAHCRGFTITLRHTALGRTPLDEWSARRRDLYLTTHNNPKGIRTGNPSQRAAANTRVRRRSHRGRRVHIVRSWIILCTLCPAELYCAHCAQLNYTVHIVRSWIILCTLCPTELYSAHCAQLNHTVNIVRSWIILCTLCAAELYCAHCAQLNYTVHIVPNWIILYTLCPAELYCTHCAQLNYTVHIVSSWIILYTLCAAELYCAHCAQLNYTVHTATGLLRISGCISQKIFITRLHIHCYLLISLWSQGDKNSAYGVSLFFVLHVYVLNFQFRVRPKMIKVRLLSLYVPCGYTRVRIGGTALFTLNLGIKRSWMISFTSRPLYRLRKKTSGTHRTGSWVGPRAGLDG